MALVTHSDSVPRTTRRATAVALLTGTRNDTAVRRLCLYADYLCSLLDGRICRVLLSLPEAAGTDFFAGLSQSADLVIAGDPDRALLRGLLASGPAAQTAGRASTALLVAREPLWPLQKLLLVARAEPSDATAVGWVCRLAQARPIAVTVLPVVPSSPGMYRQGPQVQPDPGVLLAPNTATGQALLHTAVRLQQARIACTLRFERGDPLAQVQQALAADSYELIVIAAEPHGRWQRWLLGELVTALVWRVNRPILVAQ